MAQAGFTPIQLYYSTTAAATPAAVDLAAGELAINTNDEKLYFKNSSGTVKLLASSAGASGSVTTVSVVSANGLAGTVANASTTPAITLSTTVSGLLKGNGTAISAAVSGTDYAPATSGSSILYGNGTGGFSNVTVGSGLSFAGGTLSATSGGTVTSVSGTGTVNGLTLTGTVTGSGSLTLGGTLSGVSLTTQVSGILPTANGGTGNANGTVDKLATTGFSVEESGGKLVFKYGSTTLGSLDSSGNLTVIGNVTAYGTP